MFAHVGRPAGMTQPLNVTVGTPLNRGGNPLDGTGFRASDPHAATKAQLAMTAGTVATGGLIHDPITPDSHGVPAMTQEKLAQADAVLALVELRTRGPRGDFRKGLHKPDPAGLPVGHGRVL